MTKFIKSINRYIIMGKGKGIYEDSVISEHGTWNVAADYARIKIMEPLALADQYELIATFGFS